MHYYRHATTQSATAVTASTAVTNAFGSQTYAIRVVANTPCHIRIGDGVQTATTADPYLPANEIDFLDVGPGQRLAVIRAATGGLVTATDGTLWVTELTK
jgi:hypothetical protein